MEFNSFAFLFFFIGVYFLYFLSRSKFRWIILLVTSYFFYMYWNPAFVLLIIFSTVVDFFLGQKYIPLEVRK